MRLIEYKSDEPDLKKNMKHWPYGVVDKGGKPVGFNGEKRKFVSRILVASLPYSVPSMIGTQRICAMVLVKMKGTAEVYMG